MEWLAAGWRALCKLEGYATWLLPTLVLLVLFYSVTFVVFMIIAALGVKGWDFVLAGTHMTVFLTSVMAVTIRMITNSFAGEAIAHPTGAPDYSDAEMYEHRMQWEDAVAAYDKIHALHPLDANGLWRMATILRHRLHDLDRYELALRKITILRGQPGAGPEYLVHEAQRELHQLEAGGATREPNPPREIEL